MFGTYDNPDATLVVDICGLTGEFQSVVAPSLLPFQSQVALSLNLNLNLCLTWGLRLANDLSKL